MLGDFDEHFFESQRETMVENQLRRRGIQDAGVLGAMARVPRHIFVDEKYRSQAYSDHPLPIGDGQTISQPYIVARMLESLNPNLSDRVLEIGTGSGYQTALLAELCNFVFSIERHRALECLAQRALAQLRYKNVKILLGDGSQGIPAEAPFDAIVVSAGSYEIPAPLIQQLREGGRMIIPIGPPHQQDLQLVSKQHGIPQITRLEPCRFVPLIWAGSQSFDR
jgi:protein-L-isoaspartate(D-aspartate) O-methyltransferase